MSGRRGTIRAIAAALAIAGAGAIAGAACTPSRPARSTTSTKGTKGTRGTPTGKPRPEAGTVQRGMATWYATGTMTASGERFDKRAMTAAHRTLPFGTIVKVTHQRSGKSVTVRINDRGPFGSKQRIIDVSKGAAEKLGIISEGVAPVAVEVVTVGSGRRKR